jgi:hypothetical protein
MLASELLTLLTIFYSGDRPLTSLYSVSYPWGEPLSLPLLLTPQEIERWLKG